MTDFILPEEVKSISIDENKIYELAIIGGGPAGTTATVYAARKKLDIILISRDIGGQLLLTSDIENYMGFHYITGSELIKKFEKQTKQFPVPIILNEEVKSIAADKGIFTFSTSENKNIKAKTAIIATGKRPKLLEVQGEKKFIGKGVSYCATCDAPLFKNMDVAVIGGGNSAITAVIDLLKIAHKIYVINIRDYFKADSILIEKIKSSDKTEFFSGYGVKEIKGKNHVEEILIYARKTKEEKTLNVSGVFVEIGLIPNSEFIKGFLNLNGKGEIIIDCDCKTNIPGIFAAGDVTAVTEKQIIVAAGEGAKATLSAYKYLLGMK
ncbi:MAG: FAD-dependent oxidoreductase [Candidatus Omnitrophica bacterium]|nr:FAD-dependent oxidoreductase [Candidatus Omnitrophota bacterium]